MCPFDLEIPLLLGTSMGGGPYLFTKSLNGFAFSSSLGFRRIVTFVKDLCDGLIDTLSSEVSLELEDF